MNLKADLLELLNEFSATGSIEVNKKPMSLLNEDDMKIVKRITTSKITFGDVCGMNQAKEYLKLCLSYCTNANHVKSKGVLLFGLPGTGKSLLLEALVGEARARLHATTFFSISLAHLTCSSTSEEWPELLKKLFLTAYEEKPSIIFIEDVECLGWSNIKGMIIRNAFLKQMNNIKDGVFVIANTSRPQILLDYPQILQSFCYSIYISIPDKSDRLEILKKHFTEETSKISVSDLEDLAIRTRGLSGLDLSVLFEDALRRAETRRKRTNDPVLVTIQDIGIFKRISDVDLESFDTFAKRLGARQGNSVLEQKVKVSSSSKFLTFLHDILF